MIELIDENKTMKSVVVCDNAEEIKQLRAECSSINRNNVIYAHEEMPPPLLAGNNNYLIMIICLIEI